VYIGDATVFSPLVLRPGDRQLNRAPDIGTGQREARRRARMQITGRCQSLDSGVGGRGGRRRVAWGAGQRPFGRCGADRGRGDPSDCQRGALDLVAVQRDERGHRDDGEVGVDPGVLDERVPAVPRGQPDLGQDLVGFERSAERSPQEFRRGDCAGACRAGRNQVGIERERRGGQLGRGVGVGQAAPNRSAVADGGMRDKPAR